MFLPPFAKAFPKLPMTPEPIEAYFRNLKERGPRRFHAHRALTTFYRWISGSPPKGRSAVDGRRNREKGIPNVMEYIKAPPKKYRTATAYSMEELITVVKAADNTQDRMLLLLLMATQIRSEALRDLTASHVHADYILITPKDPNEEEEQVACPPEVCTTLQLMGPGYVFTDRNGSKLKKSGVYQRVEKCFRRAGVTWGKMGPHAFRHSGATLRMEKTEDTTLIQASLGHKNISTTALYLHRPTASKRRRLIETSPFYDLPEELTAAQPTLPGMPEPDPQEVGV